MDRHEKYDEITILRLVEKYSSNTSPRDYTNPSKQLIAFAVIALVYGSRINWIPTNNISIDTRDELRKLGSRLGIDKTAYETFISSARRMIDKLCRFAYNDLKFSQVRTSKDSDQALANLLDILISKNIFTAGHMRTWSSGETLDPIGFDKNVEKKENDKSDIIHKFGIITGIMAEDGSICAKIVFRDPTSRSKPALSITHKCRSFDEFNNEIDKLHDALENVRKQARNIF